MTQRRNLIKKIAMMGAASAAAGAVSSSVYGQVDTTTGGSFSVLIAASDAPQEFKDAADFVCSGTNDNVQINQAIIQLLPNRDNGLGGEIQLSPGTFYLNNMIKMRPRIRLIGSGRSTILKATSEWNAQNTPNQMGGVIEANDLSVDKVHVASLTIDGNNKNIHGIYFNITSADFDDYSPDSANYFTDLYIYRPKGDGVHLTGGRMRAANLSRIRVWVAGGHGFYLNNPDSFFSHLEAGSSDKTGFYIAKPNNRFTNCKAWFSKQSGFEITGSRNQFSACESQDNVMHGYKITAGQVSMTSCHADSNSWNRSNTSNAYSGFFIGRYWGYVQLIACQAYDKNEDNRGYWQRYGFELEGSNKYCQIVGSAKANNIAKLNNPSPDASSSIEVIGG